MNSANTEAEGAVYFYKTENGARVGDVFMSLIHTAELGHENPFEYLVALQRHAAAVEAAPAEWMPWNFRATLARISGAQIRRPDLTVPVLEKKFIPRRLAEGTLSSN